MTTSNNIKDKFQLEIVSLTETFNEIVKKFKSLHSSITESYNKVPKATKQLDKINEQTEVATNQMLDKVEAITEREQDISGGLGEIEKLAKEGKDDEICELVVKLKSKSEINVADAYIIMDALQFQDITAQQMDHAASMLEDIESKLNDIVEALNASSAFPEKGGAYEKKIRIFDPHADLFEKKTEQREIDTMFDKVTKQKIE